MKNIRVYKKRWFPVCLLFVLFFNVFPVKAAEYDEMQKHQILFALDCSHSMSEERWQEAVDSITMISAMLPSNYETAVLTYNEGIVFLKDFGQSLEDELDDLREVKRKGYTNTGLAIETALEEFSEELSGEKRILIISDGEISMKGKEETENATLLYDTAVQNAADRNVKIDVLLFESHEIEEQISYGAQLTGGSVFVKTNKQTMGAFVENYLFEELDLERIMVGVSETSQNTSAISLQNSFAECAKVLLIAENNIENLQVSCQCEDVRIVRGDKFAVIHLKEPVDENINLQYTLEEKGKINAYLVKEYYLTVEMDAVYAEELLQHMIRIHISDAKGESILTDKDICDKVDIYVNGKKIDYVIEQENAVFSQRIEEEQEIEVRVDFDRLNSLVFSSGSEGKLLLELPPPEAVEQDDMQYFWLCVVVTGVCVIFVFLVFLLSRTKKKTEIPAEDIAKKQNTGEILKYDFAGEIVIYVLKSAGGEDVPPTSINLYKRGNKDPFSFAWVKDKCRIDAKLKDADKVVFFGGKDNTLCVRNGGDVTLFNGKDILLRSKKYTLNYNEKLLAIFNDGEIEVEIHYKNIKPSERQR